MTSLNPDHLTREPMFLFIHSPSHEKCVNQHRGILICLHTTGLLSTCICYVYLLSTLSFKFLVLYLFIQQVFMKNLLCVNIPWHAGTITVSKTNLVPLFGNSQAGGRQLPSTVPERSPGDGIPNLAWEVGVGPFRMFRSLLCVQGGKQHFKWERTHLETMRRLGRDEVWGLPETTYLCPLV